MKFKLLLSLFGLAPLLGCLSGIAHALDLVIDPGHSPRQPGAISCVGQKEYIYNDRLAARIKNRLEAGGARAVLTRTPGEDISLKARGARAAGHDLFLSVHHDSVQPQFMTKTMDNFPVSTKARGFSLFVSRKNKHFDESLAYAKRIGAELRNAGLTPTLHHAEPVRGENRPLLDRQNGIYEFNDLIVLKTADAPAVLLEAGVIAHPDEERFLSGDAMRNKIANAIGKALLGKNPGRRQGTRY